MTIFPWTTYDEKKKSKPFSVVSLFLNLTIANWKRRLFSVHVRKSWDLVHVLLGGWVHGVDPRDKSRRQQASSKAMIASIPRLRVKSARCGRQLSNKCWKKALAERNVEWDALFWCYSEGSHQSRPAVLHCPTQPLALFKNPPRGLRAQSFFFKSTIQRIYGYTIVFSTLVLSKIPSYLILPCLPYYKQFYIIFIVHN